MRFGDKKDYIAGGWWKRLCLSMYYSDTEEL